jgi:NADPH-dependent glutamate synthase beta subunit-like oxidoreductase/CO/xanthine dehydrogenase FAD-binding subunit
MRRFKHINALSAEEATSVLKEYGDKARVIAGGTDLVGQMKDNILPEYPEVIVNIKTISDLDYIREDGQTLKIGALTRLEDIAQDRVVKDRYPILAEAARRTASPHIREMGSIGGNICQSNRCWYYWVPDNRFYCARKGGKLCYALTGDGRYHSIFGGTRVNGTPCSTNCPANVDIAAYLSQIREGNLTRAAGTLLDYNPLPAITGRVCPHFCESECNRGEFDEPVSIKGIERFIGDYILDNAGKIITPPEGSTGKKVAVIGSGPAGLSAAYYLRRLGYSVTVFEKMAEAGGLLTYGIPPYRLPKDVVSRQLKALEGMGIEFKLKSGVAKDKTVKLMKSFDAVFMACGTWKETLAGVEGEELMLSGIEFLRNSNLGIREVPGKKVAVIGGGNAAVDVARTLLRLGAEPVIVYRRSRDEMPAVKEEVEKAEEEGIKIQFLTQPLAAAKKGGKIALRCTKMKLGPLDKTGRPRPVPVAGSEFTAEFDAVVKAIGEEPDTSAVPAEFLDKNGRLKADASYSLGKNVFAGGDFVTGPSTVVAALASGQKAASAIDRYLGGKVTKNNSSQASRLPAKFDSSCLMKTSRTETPELPVAERVKGLDIEDVKSLNSTAVKTEANRCFNCSCVAVNSSDMAPALIALEAKIKTTRRTIKTDDFFAVDSDKTTVLANDEIVTEIEVPVPTDGTRSIFIKFALRKSIDFPIVSCAAAIKTEHGAVKSARICLNAVYNTPYRATRTENYIKGNPINDSNAEKAANAITTDTCPLLNNSYKIQIAKTLVKRAILACK